ncbi:hypothetical protein MesoLjLb_18620 [Mesorhizobium sp. L-8-3]|nr:hypothetical protein MesoLjLb_18620 [Mesorhizobium sp. L-8-3]
MSAKLDWRRAQLGKQRSLSIRDEIEHREHDAAARWLAKWTRTVTKKRRPSSKGASS